VSTCSNNNPQASDTLNPCRYISSTRTAIALLIPAALDRRRDQSLYLNSRQMFAIAHRFVESLPTLHKLVHLVEGLKKRIPYAIALIFLQKLAG
jgi:hypothetical protein